jgi:flagellar hook-associated protein 1 FlgK
MGNLFATLHNVTDSMTTIQKALQVTGNNVSNAGTVGYVRQRLSIESRPMELRSGLSGGVLAGSLISSRRSYLESSVHNESNQQGRFSQLSFSLEQIEPVFDISQAAGIAGSMDALFRTFSQWAVSPNDVPVRESVIRAAQNVAGSFNFTAASLGNSGRNAEIEARSTITAINRLGEQLQQYNIQIRGDARRLQDPGLDAQIHAALEELSEFVDFDLLRGDDGSFNVFLGGQTPLTMGDKFYPISGDFGNGGILVRDFAGVDVTSNFQQGRLRALLDLRNEFIPSLMDDLNRLASSFADRINAQLITGVDLAGQPPPIDLFSYDAAAGAATSLAITTITPDQLAAAEPAAPGGNGNALQLASLATSREIDDFTFTQFFGQVAARVGRALSNARTDEETHSLLLSQARFLRSDITAVNLDEEAANLISFQRAYQASAELVRVVNSLTETAIQILR